MNIDWSKLTFHYTETDYIVRAVCKNGVWERPYATRDKMIPIHAAATGLHYGQECFALTRGRYAARTLVLSPFTAVADLFRGHHFDDSDPAAADLAALNTQWERINRTLIENHIDFDYGDEGDLVAAEDRIAVARMRYDRVIVLPGHTLSATAEAVLATSRVPVYRLTDDHIPSSLLEEFSADCRITVNGVNAAEVWSTRRIDGEQTILFVQSMADTEQTVDIALTAPSHVLLATSPQFLGKQ